MRLPSNRITIARGAEETFALLLQPDTYAGLLKQEYGAKIIHDKRVPMAEGKVLQLVMPATKGQLIVELLLAECEPPTGFQFDVVTICAKRGGQRQRLLPSALVDGLALEVRLKERNFATRVKFTPRLHGVRGVIVRPLAYLFLGLLAWYTNRGYLRKLSERIERAA